MDPECGTANSSGGLAIADNIAEKFSWPFHVTFGPAAAGVRVGGATDNVGADR